MTMRRTEHLMITVILLFLLLANNAHRSNSHHNKLLRFQNELMNRRMSRSLTSPSVKHVSKIKGRVIYPLGFGADPTGATDSTEAILSAVAEAFNVQKGLQMLPAVNDLGGVVIDFQGGNYNISKPITFPSIGGGNVVVNSGTLRASPTFPDGHYLIELPAAAQSSTIIFQDITFQDILFDSGYHGGGLSIINSARIRITNCYFLHFATNGILVRSGHETYISSTFLGQHETVGGDPSERSFSGTALNISSNDNAVTDVAIFSAAVGVVLSGQANMITDVHCYNKATGFGGVGILVNLPGNSQTRIDNCYLDYNSIVMEDPVQVHVTNGFFLGGGNVVIKSVSGRIWGLNIVNNMFSGDPANLRPIVELDGEFSNIDQVVVDHNNAVGMAVKSTVGKLTVAGNGTRWVADFSGTLLFPNRITHMQYGFYARGGVSGLALHGVTSVVNNTITVESDRVVDGMVSVTVDQYNAPGETGL